MAAKRSKSKKSKTRKKPAARSKAAPKAKAAAKAKAAKPRPKAAKAKASRKSAGEDRLAQLERLVDMMVARDVVEVELEEGGARWRVRRTEPQAVTYAAAPQMAIAAPAAGAAAAAPAVAEPQGELFKSPMLGTYYQAASPDAEPFAKVGDRVTSDTTLCIIEAMKVMNEIKAERDFEILEVLVKNGEPVEFGQPMFLIR
jgi:acetyl-CoA carboxylase biotin carboxyl carrier protein